jgi:serine protease Do
VSRQASSIGFAIPINQAKLILPQLKERGHVQRGYIGVALRDVDPDLRVPLGLPQVNGALVQDVTTGSPAERAGLKPYDLIVAVDGVDVVANDALIREISSRTPGSTARLEVIRDGREQQLLVKLAERQSAARPTNYAQPSAPSNRLPPGSAGPGDLGLTVIEIEPRNAHRYDIPAGMRGLLVQRVEALSPAQEAGIERGHVVLEINREPVESVAKMRRAIETAGPGATLAVFIYIPEIDEKNIRTVRMDTR